MQKNEIIDFIRAHPLFFLATCDGDQARVRGIMMYSVDELGNIVFSTGKNKPMYEQLRKNPKIECCFYSDNKQIRVQGDLIESDNQALKKEIVEARPFMKPWIDAAGYDVMGVFILTRCKATWWSMDSALSRKRYINLFED
jgi:uncharacterized pyridoxamine 5'-phosphate oxidase family protein